MTATSGPRDAGARGGRFGPEAAAAGLAGLVAFGLAVATLMPGVGYWDTAEAQTVAPILGTAHPTGFPSYVLLGWVASAVLSPFGDPAFRMNLLSAILGGAAAALTARLTIRLTGRALVGLLAGLLLATTPIAWSVANHADGHALHLALVALLLGLLVEWGIARRGVAAGGPGGRTGQVDRAADRWLIAAAVVFGISLGNHTLTLLLAPGIALYVLAVEPRIVLRPGLLARCLGALVLTTVVLYLELPLRAGPLRAPLVYGHPETWDGFTYVVLAEQFRGSLVAPFADLGTKWAALLKLAGAQLGLFALVVPVALLVTVVRRPRYALLTVPAVVITCWFAASYQNADIARYYLGPALIVSTWIGILVAEAIGVAERLAGRAAVGDDWSDVDEADEADDHAGGAGDDPPDDARAPGRRRSAAGSIPLVALAIVSALFGLLVPTIPERWRAVDRSQDRGASAWLAGVETAVEPGAIMVSWWSYSTPLWYAQLVEGKLPGVRIVDDRTRLDEHLGELSDVIDANLGRRPIYLIRPPDEISRLGQRYVLQEVPIAGGQPLIQVLRVRP